jgi:hypothetical protein
MRIGVFVNTPAQVHLYRNVVRELASRDHNVVVFARDDGCTLDLLDYYDIEYNVYGKIDASKRNLLFQLPSHFASIFGFSRNADLDLVIGMGVYSAFAAFVSRTPAIAVLDSEPMSLRHTLTSPIVTAFITPNSFTKSLGKKHYTFDGFKETAYLHPDVYGSAGDIRAELGVGDDPFVLVRFNAFNGHHDVGQRGFSLKEKETLIERLSEHARVFVSDEGDRLDLSETEGEPYDAHPALIHDALSEAELLIADTQTMVTEAALLGTPAIRSNSFVGDDDMGNFKELERAGLVYNLSEFDDVLARAQSLLEDPDTAREWDEKRRQYVGEKCNLTALLTDLVDDIEARGSITGAVERNRGLAPKDSTPR